MAINIPQQKIKLGEMLTRVTEELKNLGIHNPDVPEDWIATPNEKSDAEPDSNIAADRVEEWDERRATLSLLETEYNNILRALQKIEDGTYGICEVSGEAIEEGRLLAYPAARTKVEYNEKENS